MEETKEIRVEIPREKGDVSKSERKIRIEIPSGLKLSEEEIQKIATATENEIVEVISGTQAEQLVQAKAVDVVKVEVAKVRPKEVIVVQK